jgi:hypothetical protein
VEAKVGDKYLHHSDGLICRVKWSDRTTVVLESEDGSRLRRIDIFGLEKGYSKTESKPTQ